ncbi:MAG: hypothetical protein IPH20_21030 [Bacteroidales bacterium]|nr:hypothetical protein [Bacteroidales bacterium]
MYFINISGKNYNYSAKLMSQFNQPGNIKIEYVSSGLDNPNGHPKSAAEMIDMPYTDGDLLLFKGISEIYSTIVTDVPANDKTIVFTFRACTDIDSNNYTIVRIGAQTWMAENLNVGQRINGNWTQTNNNIVEKYCYANLESNCDEYGGLYQWNEMMQYKASPGCKGICPDGWRLPSDEEWTILSDYLGGEFNAGSKLKETGTIHWAPPNSEASNASGFSGLPGGWRDIPGSFNELTLNGSFWTSSQLSSSIGNIRYLIVDNENLATGNTEKSKAASVRCLMCDSLLSVNVTIEVSANPILNGSEVTFTATPVNGGLNPDFQWRVNGIVVPGIHTQTYTCFPGNTDVFTCVMTSDAACIAKNPATSNEIAMIVDPLPCAGTPTVYYEGMTYTTVQIGTQCWLGQNLNVGTKISECNNQLNNGVLEKYCYDYDDLNCDTYGGLYQWDEMMNYTASSNANPSGRQGICPSGWHIPSHSEWCQMATYLDESVNCNVVGWQGTDAGGKLKSTGTSLWGDPNTGATNQSGFTALPGGNCCPTCGSDMLGFTACFTSSSDYTTGTIRLYYLDNESQQINMDFYGTNYGCSVRCVKD